MLLKEEAANLLHCQQEGSCGVNEEMWKLTFILTKQTQASPTNMIGDVLFYDFHRPV